MRRLVARALLLGIAVGATPAWAAEFRAIAPAAALLYDGPSVKARRLYVAPRGMPVEVIAASDPLFVKARDVGGDVFWVARGDLTSARSVVTATVAAIRQSASDQAAVVFQAERGVLLDPVEPPAGGWVRVRHRDGAVGFVRTGEVWGL